jgi:two-component system cell cycle response regulator
MASERIQILLVEDNDAEARRITHMLHAAPCKYRLRCTPNLRRAKPYLQMDRIDIALIALSLLEGHGLDVLLEAQRSAPVVPMIVLTDVADDSAAAEALRLGAQDFLVKSELTPPLLARAVCYAISRHRAHLHLRSLSLMDELTGLYNRRGFVSLAEQRLKLTSRQHVRSTLIFIDVDNLKYINDTFGHREGDAALREIAELLRECFRDSDIIGRLGGDEFCVLLSQSSPAGDLLIRKRMARLLDKSNEGSRRLYALSVSVGAVDISEPCELEDQISRADALMYEHKRAKQAHLVRFTRLRELV